jgi:hypothetical protein
MIERWERIVLRVAQAGWIEPSHRYLGLALRGLRRSDLRHQDVVDWTLAYLGMLCDGAPADPDKTWDLVVRDGAEAFGSSEVSRWHEQVLGLIPDPETARQYVRDTAAKAIAELTERRELILLREQRDRELAVQEARQDTTKTGAQMLRFAESQDRRMRVGLKEARALRAARLAESDQVGGRRGTKRAAKPEQTTGVAPEPVVAGVPVETGRVETATQAELKELTSEPKLEESTSEATAREESLLARSASEGSVDSSRAASHALAGASGCYAPDLATTRPAEDDRRVGPVVFGEERQELTTEVTVEELASEATEPDRVPVVEQSEPTEAPAEVAASSLCSTTGTPGSTAVCDSPSTQTATWAHSERARDPRTSPRAAPEPSRDLNPRPPAERPGESWEAYRPRDG